MEGNQQPQPAPHFFSAVDAVMLLVLVLGSMGFFAYRFMLAPNIQISTPEDIQYDARIELSNNLYAAEQLIEQKEYTTARQQLVDILAQSRVLFPGDPSFEGRALKDLSVVAQLEDDLPLAADWADQAVTFYEQEAALDWSEQWNLEAARQQRISVSLARNDHSMLIVDYTALVQFYREQDYDQQLAVHLQSLAMEYYALKDYQLAEQHYLEALALAEGVWEADSATIGVMANDLGVISKELAKYKEAETYYLRAITIFEKAGAAEIDNYLTTADNLVILFEAEGKSTEAETMRKLIAPLRLEDAQA